MFAFRVWKCKQSYTLTKSLLTQGIELTSEQRQLVLYGIRCRYLFGPYVYRRLILYLLAVHCVDSQSGYKLPVSPFVSVPHGICFFNTQACGISEQCFLTPEHLF